RLDSLPLAMMSLRSPQGWSQINAIKASTVKPLAGSNLRMSLSRNLTETAIGSACSGSPRAGVVDTTQSTATARKTIGSCQIAARIMIEITRACTVRGTAQQYEMSGLTDISQFDVLGPAR